MKKISKEQAYDNFPWMKKLDRADLINLMMAVTTMIMMVKDLTEEDSLFSSIIAVSERE
jgi:hypothetical protein